MRSKTRLGWMWLPVGTAMLVGLAGCGSEGYYPVEGKVMFKDGAEAKELAHGIVVFDPGVEGRSGARGVIESDGSFRLYTHKPYDGVLLGKYKVGITPGKTNDIGVPLPFIPDRYFNPQSSGIEVTVEAKPNLVTLTVERGKLAHGKK